MNIAPRVLVAAAVLAWSTAAPAQTADEIIEKSVAAMGGRANLAKVTSRFMAGNITLGTPGGDVPGTIEILQALPNKLRILIKADLSALGAGPLILDQRFDGESGYVVNTVQGNREMSGNQLDNTRNTGFPHLFVGYQERGMKVTLQGRQKAGDRDAHVLLFEPRAGSAIRYFVDTQSLLPIRTVIRVQDPDFGEMEQTVESSDFRDVGGVKVPFTVVTITPVSRLTVVLTKVEDNGPVDAKLFVKP